MSEEEKADPATADVSTAASQSQAEEPVESIEDGDGDKDGAVASQDKASGVTEDQWRSMMDVVIAIYDYREEDGHDPSRLFQRSVNKRHVPDYYDIIKEPMALSILKQKINKREYLSFQEFVRDCALITHNAQTYNRPESQAYNDALVIKDVFVSEFAKLVDSGVITAEMAELPDLGEIPEADPLPLEDEDDDDDEDDEDDEDMDDSDDGGRRRRRRGPRSGRKDDFQGPNDPEFRKKRGRPPRVDTPMEARIKAVLKGIRKFKDPSGQLKVLHFERLPDKAMYPDYFMEIREPMAIDLIKRKFKRKKYHSVDHFMRDLDLMFNNAKSYNQPSSQLFKDAEDLQIEAHKLAEQEKKKPDSEYIMEDGRLPLPQGIVHNGELWKVGDWIHIQNANDVTKPIVAQIYRTWQDAEGEKWVNACWYYRPEQTIHHFEKHFFPNEVVKTGQYRDHRIDEVVDRCFVMFFTRYNRGRPRGFPPDKEVYVCEARYNEEKHKLNKIKTWASCLPDEVREKDYEMDLFDAPRRIRKIPSPIKHLLPEGAKETDDLPKVTWGAEKAPPLVGAVHCRPRDENESPPPEPTPSPPPPSMHAPAALPQQPAMPRPPAHQGSDTLGDTAMGAHMPIVPVRSPAVGAPVPAVPNMASAVPPQQYQSPAAPSPVPVYQALQARPGAYSTPVAGPPPSAFQQTPGQASPYVPAQQPAYASSNRPPVAAPAYNPNAPRPVEVFHLSDIANAAIPADIRQQFHCDDRGHVLFFSTPPMDVVPNTNPKLSHSLKYLAAKAAKEKKRKLREEQAAAARTSDEDYSQETKRPRTSDDQQQQQRRQQLLSRLETLTTKATTLLAKQISAGTDQLYKTLYGDEEHSNQIKIADCEQHERNAQVERHTRGFVMHINAQSVDDLAPRNADLKRAGVYLEDVN
ncbi:Chromatin structure-remodeling complex subunit RSC1 [Talaromyces islandicus]|uniref:Chromatin structure-remodeling complex subunit RSC1 n=1 Tax=Talaromyces islandicus TaxID=28573 RepID=A0A0U1LMD5_TALIS|nr:Chromatin structure-remodeling complex subunit RSC1 [Talaromyces islandicus]